MKVRPWLRRAAIIAFAILLPIAAYGLWDYIELRRLVQEIERIRDKGEPVSEYEAEHAPHEPPDAGAPRPQASAGSYYLAASMLTAGSRSRDAAATLLEALALSSTLQQPQTSEQLAALRQTAVDARDALALADRAAQLGFTRFPAGREYNYRTADLMSLAGVITARTLVASAAGHGDEAVDSIISGLQLRRALRETTWFASANDEVAAVLSLSTPSADALQRLQLALEQAERPQQTVDNFLRQRAVYIDTVWHRHYGPNPRFPDVHFPPMPSIIEFVLRPVITHQAVRVLQLWAELIEVARQPWPRNVQVGTAILDEYESRRHPIGPLARYTGGADVPLELFAQTVRADPLITDRCARTAVAVERYRRDHDGAPPHTLSDLVPHYLAAIPADPFTGAPLLYRAAADGGAYTIYSVGPNQKDDGGDLTSELQQVIKRGWGRRIIRGADVGVRVLMSRPRL